ncbi:MAG: polysaccharide deacetylase family protein [Alicyclobacillaceae bacterium]|nr:polysaccharide deacetylase family protein [Alicyclobacillaceae bacterium]
MRDNLLRFLATVCAFGWVAAAGMSSVPAQSRGASHPGGHAAVVYFTFDDGPSQRYTPQVLDILARYRVHATFFVLGSRCQEFPAIARRIRREGHQIGSHGFDHRSLLAQTEAGVRTEVLKTDEVVFRVCGVRPLYFRPPGGLVKPQDREAIHQLGHPIVLWTIDSEDWKAHRASEIVQNVERAARPGAIVLFHDGVSASRYTVQALPELIRFFRSRGYQFETLPPNDARV